MPAGKRTLIAPAAPFTGGDAAPLLDRAWARSPRASREDRRFVELLGGAPSAGAADRGPDDPGHGGAGLPRLELAPAGGREQSAGPAVLQAKAEPPRTGGAASAQGRHAVNPSLERQLLDYLLHGAAPVVQFENLLFLGLDPDDAIALHARLTAEPPPHGDALARAFRSKVGAADRAAILDRLGTFTRETAGDRMWRELAPGEQTQAVRSMSRIDAPDGVHLRSRPFGPKDGAVLPFDTLVAVSRKTERGWYWVTALGDSAYHPAPTGVSGFIESYHAASEMPEPTAHLYPVRSGDLLKDIAARYYKHSFSWGHDARVYVQAIYHANKDRDAVFRQRTDLSVDHRALSTTNLKEALELWGAARVVAGQALWIPSNSFVDRLKAAGVIHQASISKTLWDGTAGLISDLIDRALYIGGFAIGLLEGAWGALEDLFAGVKDLIAALWMVVKGIFTGFSELRELAAKIGAAWQRRRELVTAIATDFMTKWESKDDWKRGNFQGEVVGYLTMMMFIIVATAGAGGAIAGSGRFGSFIKLIQLADAAGSIGTYARKLRAAVKLPQQIVDQSAEALGRKLVKGAGDAAPDVPHVKHDAPKPPDAPEVRNHGEPYGDPRVDPLRPHRHLEKHELELSSGLDFASSWKRAAAVLETKFGVPIGRKLSTAAEGHDIVGRLARGDANALKQLGIDDVPRKLDTTGREWALIETRDGFAIVAGRYGYTELPAGTRVLAHSHPGPVPAHALKNGEQATIDLPVPTAGKTFAEIIEDFPIASKTGIVPSSLDVHAISDGGAHVIYTRFVHQGGGKIGNPTAGDTAARVNLHLSGARVERFNSRTQEYWYKVELHVKDSSGRSLWRGDLYAHSMPSQKYLGRVTNKRPPEFDRAPQGGWQQPERSPR